ncbi:jupiter microtubule associated homolog 2-like [Culicoides brevitarsis]|uniref:jupiter microtubule associated homolog 2-like n=1 Tax=Culicoides brevitarsis TaxID=469753 RepID=UPI00307B4C73
MSTFCGLPDSEKNSSRVLKPPGGGHSDIFGTPDNNVPHARPKYDQQNSSNISGALGTTDANEICEKTARALEAQQQKETPAETAAPAQNGGAGKPSAPTQPAAGGRARVPPGGHSAGGFW